MLVPRPIHMITNRPTAFKICVMSIRQICPMQNWHELRFPPTEKGILLTTMLCGRCACYRSYIVIAVRGDKMGGETKSARKLTFFCIPPLPRAWHLCMVAVVTWSHETSRERVKFGPCICTEIENWKVFPNKLILTISRETLRIVSSRLPTLINLIIFVWFHTLSQLWCLWSQSVAVEIAKMTLNDRQLDIFEISQKCSNLVSKSRNGITASWNFLWP